MRRKYTTSTIVPVPATRAFDVIHDYDCRLRWDTMLSRAQLLDGATEAGVGIRSVCVGDWTSLCIPMVTNYIRFDRGQRAAVVLVKPTWFFRAFAASICHRWAGDGVSEVVYTYSFCVRPRWLSWLITPVVDRRLRREVRARLVALRDYLGAPPE